MGWVEVWEWVWLGGGRVCLGWDSIRRAVDMVEGQVELVGVELVREWSWVGWRQGRYGGYDGCKFGLGGENGVWRVVRMRPWVGRGGMVLYGDWVEISGVALCGYIHSSPYTIPTPDTPHPPNLLLPPIPISHPNPTYLPNSS